MLQHIVSSSLLICAVLIIRKVFRNKVPNRMIYALWIAVCIRLVLPGFAFEIALPVSDTHSAINAGIVQGFPFNNEANLPLNNENDSAAQPETPTDIQSPQLSDPSQNVPSINTEQVIKYIYLLGLSAALLWVIFSQLAVWQKLKRSRIWLKKEHGINIYLSEESVSPCVFGIIPSIYLPAKSAHSEELGFIMKHELMHIKQLDNIRSVIRKLLVAIYWFDPLVWVYMIAAARDSELACDEAVASKLNENQRLQYAKTIFNYTSQIKSSATGFGGKPMKKRILAIIKNSRFSRSAIAFALILSVAVCAFSFVGCDESEPLPEGASSEADVPAESLVDSDTGEIKWPAELLPEGFPVPEYTEIYSAERKDNEVVIVMFAEYNKYKRPAHYTFENDLHFKYGYRTVMDLETGDAYWLSRDGYKFTVISSKHPNTHLTAINEKSPTGYTYEIRLSPTDVKIDSLFWQYPDANTDLGLEEKVYEDWDESIFPENFPKPTEGLTIVSIEQKSNGVFLELKGTRMDESLYLQEIYRSGFYNVGVQPWRNENGDYFFEVDNNFGADPDVPVTFYLQICKYNDKVVK